jgi:hypothetical protein
MYGHRAANLHASWNSARLSRLRFDFYAVAIVAAVAVLRAFRSFAVAAANSVIVVRPTSLTLSCAARARVSKFARRDGCAFAPQRGGRGCQPA